MCTKSFKAGRGRAGRSVSRNDRLVEAQVKTSCAFGPEAENNDMHKSADCPRDITERAVALGINKQCPRRETAGEHLVVGRVSVVELSCAGAHIVSPIRLTQMFFGSLVSGGVFVVSLGALMTVGWIASDINDMYEQAEQQVDEFKMIYDLAWKRVMHKDSVGPTADFATLIGRNKRNAQCNCGAKSKGCPDGPPGPPGEPGKDGEDGKDGEPGKAGIGGMAAAMGESEKKECIVCPAGPPGPPGEDGPQGPPGDDGTPGENGEAGNAGPDGEQGPPGADGRPGAPGKPGPMGHPGHPGIVYAPGRPGRPGMPGARGPPGPGGEDGKDGQDGQPGEQGPAGTPGKDGEQGGDGQPGAPGPDGEPGADAGYCSCPARSQAMRYFD